MVDDVYIGGPPILQKEWMSLRIIINITSLTDGVLNSTIFFINFFFPYCNINA